jgi:hypothetical protein
MEVTSSSETSVDFQRTTLRYSLEERTLHNHVCENLNPRVLDKLLFAQLFGRSVSLNCCWSSPAQSLSVPVHAGLMTICLNESGSRATEEVYYLVPSGKLLVVLASTIIIRPGSRGTHDHMSQRIWEPCDRRSVLPCSQNPASESCSEADEFRSKSSNAFSEVSYNIIGHPFVSECPERSFIPSISF